MKKQPLKKVKGWALIPEGKNVFTIYPSKFQAEYHIPSSDFKGTIVPILISPITKRKKK